MLGAEEDEELVGGNGPGPGVNVMIDGEPAPFQAGRRRRKDPA